MIVTEIDPVEKKIGIILIEYLLHCKENLRFEDENMVSLLIECSHCTWYNTRDLLS